MANQRSKADHDTGNEWLAYVNGEIVPESKAVISIFDDGFLRGDAAYDSSRTFNGRIFQLEEHVDRLLDSCRYLRLDPGMSRDDLISISVDLVERNVSKFGNGEDVWISQRVARGITTKPGYRQGATVVLECSPLPIKERAPFYRDGVPLEVSSVRRVPQWAESSRAKIHARLNLVYANLEVRGRNPQAWAILLDENGHLTEGFGGFGFNIFIVRKGELLTPKEIAILPGISRANVLMLAKQLNIPAREADIDLFDIELADEFFVTSTSLCMCPVASINGLRPKHGAVGPITRKLMAAYSEFVGMDFVAQHLAHL